MFKSRWKVLAATAVSTSMLAAGGCKKDEPKKAPAAAVATDEKKAEVPAPPPPPPELPDVELVAGDGVVGWVSFASFDAFLNAADAIAGKLQLTAPGGSLKAMATDNLTTVLAAYGVTGTDWLDKTKPIHVGYQDEAAPAAAAGAEATPPNPALGTFIVLHTTDKAKALGAMAAAKKGAEAEGHEAVLDVQGNKIYIDFVGDKTLVLTPKDRFAKVKGFIERLDKVTIPGTVYIGFSIDDLNKTRAKEIGQVLDMVEQGAVPVPGAAPQPAGQAQLFAGYAKKLRALVAELARVEIILNADADLAKFEVRVTAKDGSKLQKQFASTKGKTPTAITNLLPATSWLSFAAAVDPVTQAEGLEENLAMLKDLLKLDDAAQKQLVADLAGVAKLQDGTSALALYQDGTSPLGLLIGAGATDAPQVLTVTKKVVSALLLKLVADQEAAAGKDAPQDPQLAIVKKAIADMKLEPIVAAYGPIAKEKGVTLTLGTAADGDTNCDTLDVAMDWAKLGAAEESKTAKALIGDKTSLSLCVSKTKLAFSAGPGALEQGKRFAGAKAGGLAESAVYKAGTEKVATAWGVLFANPGAALAAFKPAFADLPTIPADKAVVGACLNRAKSVGCELDVPVALIAAIKTALAPAAPAAPGAAPGAAPAPGAPSPLGGPAAAPAAPAAAPTK